MVRKWCASDLHAANYCGMRWYLEEEKRIQTDRISAFAKGDVVHRLIETFWDWKENRIGTDKKYREKTREQFVLWAENSWMRQIKSDEFAMKDDEKSKKRQIVWKDEHEKWVMLHQIGALAGPIYEMMMAKGQGILPSEYSYDFTLTHDNSLEMRFNGKIDEVYLDENGRPVVRDYKTGRMKTGEMKLGWDPQPTMYCLALSVLAHRNRKFARIVGLEDEAPHLLQPEHFLSRNITFEYCLLEDISMDKLEERKKYNQGVDSVKKKLFEGQKGNIHAEISIARTHREDKHYFAMLDEIIKLEEALANRTIRYERGEKCDYCPIRNQCLENERNERAIARNEPGVQGVFVFAKERFLVPKGLALVRKVKQKRFDWAKAERKAEREEKTGEGKGWSI